MKHTPLAGQNPEGRIEVPGAWGVAWEDLTKLDYSRPACGNTWRMSLSHGAGGVWTVSAVMPVT